MTEMGISLLNLETKTSEVQDGDSRRKTPQVSIVDSSNTDLNPIDISCLLRSVFGESTIRVVYL